MTDTDTDDDPTTWNDPREHAKIRGEKRRIDDQTRRQAERRREGLGD